MNCMWMYEHECPFKKDRMMALTLGVVVRLALANGRGAQVTIVSVRFLLCPRIGLRKASAVWLRLPPPTPHIYVLLKGKPSHSHNLKTLFEQKSIRIGQRPIEQTERSSEKLHEMQDF